MVGAKQARVRDEREASMRLTLSRALSTEDTRDAERSLWLLDNHGSRYSLDCGQATAAFSAPEVDC